MLVSQKLPTRTPEELSPLPEGLPKANAYEACRLP